MTLYISDPKDIIINLKKVIDEKGLKPIDLVEMTENSDDPISLSTARRFLEEGSEDKEFSFRHIIMPIANCVTDVKIINVDDTPEIIVMKEMLAAKAEIIKRLENEIVSQNNKIESLKDEFENKLASEERKHQEKRAKDRERLEKIIDFRTERISRLDEILDSERQYNQKLTSLVEKLIQKCENCKQNEK